MHNPGLEFFATRTDTAPRAPAGAKRARAAVACRIARHGAVTPGRHGGIWAHEQDGDEVRFRFDEQAPYGELVLHGDLSFVSRRELLDSERTYNFSSCCRGAPNIQLGAIASEFVLHALFLARYAKRLGQPTATFTLGLTLHHFNDGLLWWGDFEEGAQWPEGAVWQTRFQTPLRAPTFEIEGVELKRGAVPADLLDQVAEKVVQPIVASCGGQRHPLCKPNRKDAFAVTSAGVVAHLGRLL